MKKTLRLWMAVVFTAVFGLANASAAQWFGYALYTSNGANWQNHFISFDAQNPDAVQAVSDEFPVIWAATYLDGYVWFVTNTRSLCKAPFNEETQTISAYETVVPALEQYNLYIDMAYNPVDGMMYYLCQDSQYNSYLKRSRLSNPSEIEVVGGLSQRIWTLAINAQGQAYGVAYEGGDLYQIHLDDASTTLVGPTGQEVWYTQSMAFDLDTGELFWAQFATVNDHGLFKLNTETGAATSLGEIGHGTQLAGLFMVPQNVPEPEVIDEIYVEGFTAPAWGEHPDYDIEVSPTAPYIITDVSWHRYVSYDDYVLEPEEYFDLDFVNYFMLVILSPKEGFVFGENPMVYFDNDSSVFDYGIHSGDNYRVYTIDYQVSDPTGVFEQTEAGVAIWPNPVTDILYLNVIEGVTISIFNMTGQLLRQESYRGKIDISNLAPGIYAIQAEDFTVRFVKE